MLRSSAYFSLLLFWALSVAAYTPCSYDAWVDEFSSCMQPCYGEQYYDSIFNTDKCGNYSVGASSTKRSHVKCLCEYVSFTLKTTNQSEICKVKNNCYNSTDYNATRYEDVVLSFSQMCSWARGEISKCSLAPSFFPMQPLMLTGLAIVVGLMVY